MISRRLCVYCGASPGARPAYAEAARGVGRLLAERGIGLVYGGGSVGLMGALADACLQAGGEVVGVLPRGLFEAEGAHAGLTRLITVASMHERKARMTDLSDAFLVLPGGLGTLDEAFEALTWRQLGIHPKPLGLLTVDGFPRHLVAHLDDLVAEGFVSPAFRDSILVDADPGRLVGRLMGP